MATWRDLSDDVRTGSELETTYVVDTSYSDAGSATTAARTTYLQNIIDEAQDTNGVVQFPPGYDFTVTGLTTSESFSQPSIEGLGGGRSTRLIRTSSGPIIKYVGGSGQLCKAFVSNLELGGDADCTCIEIAGAGGLTVDNVRFKTASKGVLFHNEVASTFTEFNVIRNSHFESDVTTHVEYKRTSGTDSFHGSGFEGCVFNQDPADLAAKVVVGENCKVYNAPWSGHFFATAEDVPLITNDGVTVTCFGDIALESSSSSIACPVVDTGSANPVLLAGRFVALNEGYTTYPWLRFVEHVAYDSDGSLSALYAPFQLEKALTTGANTIFSVDPGLHLVSTRCWAANYDWQHAFVVYRSPYDGTGSLTEIAQPVSLNDAAYGEPTFSISSGNLVITDANFPASGVTAQVGVTPMLSRQSFPLK